MYCSSAGQNDDLLEFGLVEVDVGEVNLLLHGHLSVLAVPLLRLLDLQTRDRVMVTYK